MRKNTEDEERKAEPAGVYDALHRRLPPTDGCPSAEYYAQVEEADRIVGEHRRKAAREAYEESRTVYAWEVCRDGRVTLEFRKEKPDWARRNVWFPPGGYPRN